ncbi:hypothetical protein CTEN210_12207 [Chaetoceros tenuissimus]|uniref:Uncharacterized protein n=1 Tax=Chaetoceros tenuissimus TaxID=426638 RepID=A0AAD3D2S8_9STRA|nr:hypothetical protein CTEN210_12207 [Chaetoceros tenuissimus]
MFMSNDSFEETIFLSVDDQTRHWDYFGRKPSAAIHKSNESNGAYSSRTIQIHNGRNQNLKLDEASFELVNCPTSLSKNDFYEIQQGNTDLLQKYYQEVTSFIQQKLGCDQVICFHHQVRNEKKRGQDGVEDYAGASPHTDSSPVSADQLALSTIDHPERYERYLYLNLWRNIAHEPIENDHLAMVDEQTTVKPDDYIVKDLYGNGYTTVQYGLNARHAAQHKWYYFPDMQRDEAIIFKQMDSDFTKQGRICFHMSAHNSQVKNYKPRESIELRMMCYWHIADSGVNSMPTNENIGLEHIRDPEDFANELSLAGFSLNPFTLIKKCFTKRPKPVYSGNPHDYLHKFVDAVNYYSYWSRFEKSWVEKTMARSKTAEEGIFIITKGLVDDDDNYFKTKYFHAIEKKEIVVFLMASETFMDKAKEKLVENK